jgi:hypothetical protein
MAGRQGRRAKVKEPDSVCVAYVHDVEVPHSFHTSYLDMVLYDFAKNQRIMRGGYIRTRYGTGGIVTARNKTARQFVAARADWLFWIDSDMGFRPDTVDRLVAAADEDERPIVGGLCFANKEVHEDGYGGYVTSPRVTIFDYGELDGVKKFAGRREYPRDQLVRCAGSACIIIHRSVLERMEKEYGPTWYSPIMGDDGEPLGEDISFCVRATSLDIPIYVHTGVRTTHLKYVWLGEDLFDLHHGGEEHVA